MPNKSSGTANQRIRLMRRIRALTSTGFFCGSPENRASTFDDISAQKRREALDVLLDRRLVVLQPALRGARLEHALFLEGEDRVLDVLERERLRAAQLIERDVARPHLPRNEQHEQIALDEVARDAAHLGDPVGLGYRERAVLGERERA